MARLSHLYAFHRFGFMAALAGSVFGMGQSAAQSAPTPQAASIAASSLASVTSTRIRRQRRRSIFDSSGGLHRSGFDLSPPKNQRQARKLKRSKAAGGDRRAFA